MLCKGLQCQVWPAGGRISWTSVGTDGSRSARRYESQHFHQMFIPGVTRQFELSRVNFAQLLSHQERVAEMQEKQVNLKKDLAEMQEWMAQVDDEFLMRDFEYKGPEELEASLEEMKVRRFFFFLPLLVSRYNQSSLINK